MIYEFFCKFLLLQFNWLSHFNKQCGEVLIETSQREDICEIIIMASHLKGYNDMSEDITEEWREW